MREIKFRAWDTIQNEMHQWSYLKTWNWKDIESQKDVILLMQYTGCKDINKKEIYEGDICRIITDDLLEEFVDGLIGTTGVIDWVESGCEYWLSFIAKKYPCSGDEFLVLRNEEWNDIGDIQSEYLEIIGNIYENPELKETN